MESIPPINFQPKLPTPPALAGVSFSILCLPEIEPECGPGKNLDLVTHHTHFVEGGLSVEHDVVIILHVSLHLIKESSMSINQINIPIYIDLM